MQGRAKWNIIDRNKACSYVEEQPVKCLVFGSLNIDHVYGVKEFIRPGETISSISYERFCGGKGFNQAIALARAGAPVYMAGAAGPDGEMLLSVLRDEGVSLEYLQELDVPTGHAIIQVDSHGQNCIIIHSGANGQISRELIDRVLSGFESGDWLVLQNEISNLSYLITAAHEKGLKILLNPSPFDKAFFTWELLRKVDCLILNETEGAGLTGKDKGEDILSALAAALPDTMCVLTLGTEGSMAYSAGEYYWQSAYLLKAVDTTAAGDTYTGYLLAQLISGAELPRAMEVAAVASGISVTRKGASSSVPQLEEVINELEKNR